jgi:DNA-binding NtrC family response regulator
MESPDKPQLLFVDDEPRVLSSIKMLFFGSGYAVHCIDSGAAALDFLKQRPVDVIVSDQRMPGMTGVEFLRAARELQPRAMRILLTGYSDLTAIIGSINDGEIFRFVNKPWSNEELVATVGKAAHAARSSPMTVREERSPAGQHLLVLDEDPAVAARLRQILGTGVHIHAAATADDAVTLLDREPIGVIVSDTRLQQTPVIDLIGTLRQHHPELVSIILTERADAGMAIELINRGQIYRFITKPIHDLNCRIAIDSAMRQHQKLALNPEQHQRYEVQPPPREATVSGSSDPQRSSAGLFDRIRAIRGWVSRRS